MFFEALAQGKPLSEISFHSLQKVNLEGRNFLEWHPKRGNINESTFTQVEFRRCRFSECRFSDLSFVGCRFVECRFEGCFWIGNHLEGCIFEGCHFMEWIVENGTFVSPEFSSSVFSKVEWHSFNVVRGRFKKVDAVSIGLLGGILQDSLLEDCGWHGAIFHSLVVKQTKWVRGFFQNGLWKRSVFEGCSWDSVRVSGLSLRGCMGLTGGFLEAVRVGGGSEDSWFERNLKRLVFKGMLAGLGIVAILTSCWMAFSPRNAPSRWIWKELFHSMNFANWPLFSENLAQSAWFLWNPLPKNLRETLGEIYKIRSADRSRRGSEEEIPFFKDKEIWRRSPESVLWLKLLQQSGQTGQGTSFAFWIVTQAMWVDFSSEYYQALYQELLDKIDSRHKRTAHWELILRGFQGPCPESIFNWIVNYCVTYSPGFSEVQEIFEELNYFRIPENLRARLKPFFVSWMRRQITAVPEAISEWTPLLKRVQDEW